MLPQLEIITRLNNRLPKVQNRRDKLKLELQHNRSCLDCDLAAGRAADGSLIIKFKFCRPLAEQFGDDPSDRSLNQFSFADLQ